ncbi:MAG: hypothetical protein ACREQ8_14845 [Woeseiaceae bacterium]
MAEAEEVVSDVARHATVFARDLWRRHREREGVTPTLLLADVAVRIDLLVNTVFGASYPIRMAQRPAPTTLLTAVFGRRRGPLQKQAIPATDGVSLWLPADLGIQDPTLALRRYRTMALQQAMRARRRAPEVMAAPAPPLFREIALLVEASAADRALVSLLPGVAKPINELRKAALAARPLMSAFPKYAQPLENLLRIILKSDCREPLDPVMRSESPGESMQAAAKIVAGLLPARTAARASRADLLLKDCWTGELHPPPEVSATAADAAAGSEVNEAARQR